MNSATTWWCKQHKYQYPDEDSQLFLLYQKQALISLRSEIVNNDGLSAMELAAKSGATDLIERMIQIPKVFVKRGRQDYSYDVTDLLPVTVIQKLFSAENTPVSSATRQQHNIKVLKDDERQVLKKKKAVSLLNMIVDVRPLHIADQMLNIVPFRQIVEDYWTVYQYIYWFLMMVHITYMTLLSIYGIASISETVQNKNHCGEFSLFLIWPALLYGYELYLIVTNIFQIAKEFDFTDGVLAKINEKSFIISNVPSFILAIIMHHLAHIMCILFSSMVMLWYLLYLNSDPRQASVLATVLLVGWLFTISFTDSFETVHGFTAMLRNIFIRDVIRFFFLYIFILLGFGFAFEALIQLSEQMKTHFPNHYEVFYHTFAMMIELGDMMVDGIDLKFKDNPFAGRYYKFLHLLYALITIVVLLNLLIAMMSDSYSEVKEKEGTSFRVSCIEMSIRLEKSFPLIPKLFTLIGIKGRNICLDEESQRWILTLPRREAEQEVVEQLDASEKMLAKLDGKLDRLKETQDDVLDRMNALGLRVERIEYHNDGGAEANNTGAENGDKQSKVNSDDAGNCSEGVLVDIDKAEK